MDKEARRQQVLDCARDVFAEKGYHATKVEDIVTRAGVARGTFYLYFQDKRSVFEKLLNDFLVAILGSITRIEVDDPSRDVVTQMRSNVRNVMGTLLANKTLAKIMLSATVGLDAEFDARLLAFYEQVAELLDTTLRQGYERGIVKNYQPRIAAYFLLGGLKEIMYHIATGRLDPDLDELVEDMFAFTLRGVVGLDAASSPTVAASR